MPIDPKTFESDLRALLDEMEMWRKEKESQKVCWQTVAFILARYMVENGMDKIRVGLKPADEDLIHRFRTAAINSKLSLGFSHDDITICIEEPGGRFVNPFKKG